MDSLIIRRLECYGFHGVFDEERKLGQRFYVDLELELDLEEAGKQDDLSRTVNYAEICELVRDIVDKKSFQLIEALAECIATTVLDTYTRVDALTVAVTKPHPPFDVHFAGVMVELRRSRK